MHFQEPLVHSSCWSFSTPCPAAWCSFTTHIISKKGSDLQSVIKCVQHIITYIKGLELQWEVAEALFLQTASAFRVQSSLSFFKAFFFGWTLPQHTDFAWCCTDFELMVLFKKNNWPHYCIRLEGSAYTSFLELFLTLTQQLSSNIYWRLLD